MVDSVQASDLDIYGEDLEHGLINIQYQSKSSDDTKVMIEK